MDDASIIEHKAELRARMLETRNGIDPVHRLELAETIHAKIYDLPQFREASSLGLYWASGSEVLTISLAIKVWEQEERRIFLPFVLNGELQLTEWRTADPVVDAAYGGMHPRYRRAAALEEVDMLLVPGLAFDSRGRRLGTGTGHYDRLLARLDPRTTRVGLCFAAQMIDEVPIEPHDQRVEFVVTEDGVVACAPVANGTHAG